ncbi:unnamed protein product [Brachionus calyciflorus]|uniref:DUF3730 domain-containing protein n=1 Tax=Brachionus calyciflorus TaxID=104777 RepID=A0A813WXE4_9BILA|nr:unnamed protein product [Brachionus calyciflorus]
MDFLPNSKLVDLCNKLVSGNTMVQYQALAKVNVMIIEYSNNEVEKKRTVLKLVDTLKLIKSKNCCLSLLKILVKLAIENSIDYTLLINSFLSLINSKAENSIYCFDSMRHLLINFRIECIEKYSIRNPTHPFLDILRNSNDNFNEAIYHQIYLIYEDKSINMSEASRLLKPVFIYIFLESVNLKHLIGSFLINKLSIESNDQIIRLINLYLSSIKKSDLKDIHLYNSINTLINMYQQDENLIDRIKILDLLNLIIKIDSIENYNFSKQWNSFSKLIESKKHMISSELLELLANNLSRISYVNLENYLKFVEKCLMMYEGKLKIDLAIFLPNLFLYVMSLGHVESINSFHTYRSLITNLISLIEKRIQKSLLYNPISLTKSNLFNLIEYEDNDPLTEDPNEKINKNLLNLLSAHFIANESDIILNQRICTVFQQIARKWPNLYGIIYSLYIYKLRVSTNNDIINYLLNSMTDLIGPKIDINLCLGILKSLMLSSTGDNLIVKLICMKQLTKLCTMKYDYLVYPHLSNELITIKQLQLSESDRHEILYMKTYCIHQIITYRPDYYAQELLATISNLLNQCTQINDQGICSILIDTLAYLCETEVVDMMSTWNALLPQFKNEKRVLTLNSYCRFMSVASKLKHLESENESSFYFKMMQSLWSLSDPIENVNQEKWKIISAALKELSKFNKINFKCSFLPSFIQEKVKERNKKILDFEENKEKSLNEIFPRIQSICYIDLFQSLEPESYEGLAVLFKNMLTEEIDSIPRRSVSFAKEKIFSQDEQHMAQKNFYEHIKHFLVDEYNNSLYLIESSSAHNIDVGYILYCYDAPADRNREGNIAKKHIKSYWKNYEKTLSLILQKGIFNLAEENLDYFTKGFNRFINNSYNACIQSLTFEYNSELDEKLGHAHVTEIRNKIANAWSIARDKHLEILTETYKVRSHEPNSNDLFLIVLNSLIESSTDYIKNNLKSEENSVYNQRKWLEVLVDFILNIKENKTASESEYINMFSYKQAHSSETLKFLFKVYQKSNFISYFLACVLPSCVQIKISSFLIQYIHRIQTELFQKSKLNSNDLKSMSVYLKNSINLEKEFTIEHNYKINEYFENLLAKFKLQINDPDTQIVNSYLESFVQCFSQLYNEESIYYDDKNILEQILNILNEKLKTCFYEFNTSAMSTLVNLTCLAYKSNLIKNENLILIYDVLNKESRFNVLLSLYCRFLISYGFYDSVEWIEKAFCQWMKFYGDYKLNLTNDNVELVYCVKGILSILTGVSTEYISFDQVSK